MKIDFALSIEGFLELCLASFRRNRKTEMTWKKILAPLFLPKTSLPLDKRSEMTIAARRGQWWLPVKERIQVQSWVAKLQEKKRRTSDSSSLKQLEHLDAMDHPFCFVQIFVGVYLSINLQLKQASLRFMKLFHISPAQRVSVPLVCSRFQASLIERSPDGLSCHSRISPSEQLPKESVLVERTRKSFSWVGRWVGIC